SCVWSAGLLLTAGSLGDRFGRKRALDIGLVVFAAGSVLSAFAGSPGTLIASRALMGIGGAFIMPSTLSITTNVFTGRERTRAIGVWAAMAALGIAIGPVAGGWLLAHFWWGSVFLVNLPVVALALVAGVALVPESKDPAAGRPDPFGAVLSVVGLTSLGYRIIEGPSRGWTDPLVLAAFGLAVVVLGAFAAWELRTDHPMLQLRLFANPRFSAASLSIALVFFALFGTMYFLTLYLQTVLGYTALQAGIRIIPMVLGMAPAARLSPKLIERFGTKLVVVTGMVVAAGALTLLSRATPTSGYGLVAAFLVLQGIGMGLAMVPATDSIMATLPRAKAGVGSAMNDTVRQVGGALGVAVLGSVLSAEYGRRMAETATQLPAQLGALARDSVGAAHAVADRLGPAGRTLVAAAGRALTRAMSGAVLGPAALPPAAAG